MAKEARGKHDGFLVESFGGWNGGTLGGEKYGFSESRRHQGSQERTAGPSLECRPAKIDVVDFDALLDDVLRHAFQKRFLALQFVECRVDEIDSQNTDGFLLEDVGGIQHVDVHQDVVGRAAGLRLKTEPDPTIGVVASGEVARGDGIHKGKAASLRPARLL